MSVAALLRGENRNALIDFVAGYLPEKSNQRAQLRDFCKDAQQLVLSRGEAYTVSREHQICKLETPDMPFGYCMHVPLKSSDFLPEPYELEILLICFPYTTESQFNQLSFRCEDADRPRRFRIVVFHDHQGGYTDYGDPQAERQNVVIRIQEQLEKLHLKDAVDVLDDAPDRLWKLFRGRDRAFRSALTFEQIRLRKVCERLKENKENFQEYYNKTFGNPLDSLVSSANLEKYVSYKERAVRISRDLIQTYVNGFLDGDEWEKISSWAVQYYEQITEELCFWNHNEDLKAYREKLREYAYRTLLQNHKILKAPADEKEYEDMRKETKCIIDFQNRVKSFVSIQDMNDANSLYDFIQRELTAKAELFA